jgi:myo-inositol-1(or 4)-monophosphatase
MKSFVKEREIAIKAALSAGALLRRHLGTLRSDDVDVKKRFDYVTVVDKKSEKLIIETIRQVFPKHKFYAEESARDEGGGFRWIIDPLDGTTNFIHSVPLFAVSIGLEVDHEIVLGVIYDPMRKELFVAERGKGAFVNNQPIHVSATSQPEVSLLGTGFPFRIKEQLDTYLKSFRELFFQTSGIRRVGAVALDFAWVASGRYEGFWEIGLSPWDVAAGYLLVREAGGMMTDFSGGDEPVWSGNVVASNGHLHPMLMQTVKHVFSGVLDK